MKRQFDICVLPGDGIGAEVIDATLPVLDKVQKGFSLRFADYPAGAQHYKSTGEALPERTFEAAKRADAILFGAMGWPEIRYPDGTEIAPQLDLRFRLELYAGVRPVRAIPGIPLPLGRSARARDRPRRRARIHGGAVRIARQGRGGGRPRGARHDGHHPQGGRARCTTSPSASPHAGRSAASRASTKRTYSRLWPSSAASSTRWRGAIPR